MRAARELTRRAGTPRGWDRAVELFRPVGRSRWGMAAALAVTLGSILVVPGFGGRSELGSAVALGFVLTAVPELPETFRAAVVTMAVRSLTVCAGAAVVMVIADRPLLLGAAIVAAAVTGALIRRVGATAGLSVVLIAVDTGVQPVAAELLWYALGAVVVCPAWLAWFACAHATGSAPDPAETTRRDGGVAYAHAGRVAVAVASAVAVSQLLPADMVGGHWLITSVLLTIQPRQADTGVRLAQRLSGNAVGAVIAAVLLGARPPAQVVIGATVVLFLLAMALRPVNYTWWAVTGPPVLLVVSEYPQLFPWYEGGVRLAMNLLGAAIVLVVVFGAPVLARLLDYRRR